MPRAVVLLGRPTPVLVTLTLLVSLLFTFGPGSYRMGPAGAVAVSLLSAGAVWLSGRRPAWALGAVVVVVLAQPVLDVRFAAADLVVVLVAYRAAAAGVLPVWSVATLTLAALAVHDWWLRPWTERPADPTLLYPVMVTALAVGLGAQVRRVRAQGRELVRLQQVDRDRAVAEERRRISRDLHDVAAHHLSALVVRNRLAQRLGTPDAWQAAVEFSAVTASDTLGSLRHVVGALGADDGRPDEPPRSPTPLLRDLPAVLDRVGAAGLQLERRLGAPGSLADLDDELQVALVRITQEALSNVLRHRGPGPAWVELRREGATVTLTVDDDGAGGTGVTGDATVEPGRGVLGMRERARSRGGRLSLVPSPRGGLRVQAVFDARGPT